MKLVATESNRAMSSVTSSEKKKKTKSEKICELQADMKLLKEENRRLQKEISAMNGNRPEDSSVVTASTVSTSATSSNNNCKGKYDEKLKEAMKALKRVTISQEQCLNQMQQKAQERRKEIKMKDSKISSLQRDIKSLRKVQDQIRESATDGDVGSLQQKVSELQVKCGELDTQNGELAQKLRETEDECSRLQREVVRGKMHKQVSSRSVKSDAGSSVQSEMESVVKMKKELAQKIEKIVLLEMDLELVKDELHELRQKEIINDAFQMSDFKGSTATDDDFFDDDEEDDDPFWS